MKSLSALGVVVGIAASFWWLAPRAKDVPAIRQMMRLVKGQENFEPGTDIKSQKVMHDERLNAIAAANKVENPYKTIFEKYPYLKSSEHFYQIVLPSAESTAQKREFFTNREMLEENFSKLAEAKTDSFDDWTPLERVFRVDVIKQAAAIKDNPHRDFIKDKVMEGIQLYPSQYETLSESNKKSLVADKVELYMILLKYFPEHVKAFNAEVKDPKIKKIMNYTRQNIELLSQIDMQDS